MALIIKNARVVLKDRVLDRAAVILEDGVIQDVYSMKTEGFNGPDILDARGMYVMPGLIDIHSDAVEKEVEPRPGIRFPLELALAQLERRLASQGLTSIFHSVSFAGGEGVREDHIAREIILHVKRRIRTVIRNWVHLRYEITNFESLPIINELLDSGHVDLFSIMDHSPGQGQYQTFEDYANYVRKTYRLPEDQIIKVANDRIARSARITPDSLKKLVEAATSKGIPVASHDDDSVAKVQWARGAGISVAEFPINVETAQYAAEEGMFVIVGSPNIARGGSHNGNLSAMDLIKTGYANLICSDYYTGSMLYAVFRVADVLGDLTKAVRMATLNPAAAVRKDSLLGSIEAGKRADLIIVGIQGEWPVVYKTFVDGQMVYSGDYWNGENEEESLDYCVAAEI